jgi:cytochrome c biogenesis protein CcdA/thiol-disulfide isomerase/thioredoxin
MILILLTYLAGALTILSPCILPVLPFVFSRAEKSFVRHGIPLLVGMALTFSLFSSLAIVGGEWVSTANGTARVAALVMLSLFGLSLIFPHLAERAFAPLAKLGGRLGNANSQDKSSTSFLVGVSTGLLWAPCAGPILGLVLTGAATQKNFANSITLLASYSIGAATSLALALVAGGRFLGMMKKFLGVDRVLKKGLGWAVLAGVAVISLGLDRSVLTQLAQIQTSLIETKLTNSLAPELGDVRKSETPLEMPEFSGATTWLNSPALLKADLRGKVVLVDFWTYSCINCLRTLPHVKSWSEKYKSSGLVVVGIHTPEFAFERNAKNVSDALKNFSINYPVALDNDYKIWNAFKNRYWPGHHFVDRQGRVRRVHYGETDFEGSEIFIRELLSEGAALPAPLPQTAAELARGQGIQAPSSGTRQKSPETYLGYARALNFAGSPELQPERVSDYSTPRALRRDEWSLEGSWKATKQKVILQAKGGKIRFRFRGRDLHLVLGSPTKVSFRIRLDGKPLGPNHGMDVNSAGHGEIQEHRLYQLIRIKNHVPDTEHDFEIEFLGPQVEAYAFTFG